MGIKVTVDEIENVGHSSGLPSINDNFEELANEFDDVLYRDGSQSVTGDLDMDSNRILNLPEPTTNNEPLRYVDGHIAMGAVMAAANYYPTQELGEDATVEGEFFSFSDSGQLFYAERDAVGSTIIGEVPSVAALNGKADSADLAADDGGELIGYKASGTGTVARNLFEKLSEVRTLEDFGAVGYNSASDATAGTDSTAAIQAAIDWAYNGGASVRSIRVTGNFFKCGNITMHNSTTLIGSGRQTSGFVAKAGTTGIWFDSDNAQKTTLEGLIFYGNNETGITRICSLVTGQAGTEGHIKDCWFRNAPNGYGLYCDGNVYVIENTTFETCKFPLYLQGTMNQLTDVRIMQAGHLCTSPDAIVGPTQAIGIEVNGAANIKGIHLEATSEGALPIKVTGDVHLYGVTISNAAGYDFSHLIEVNSLNYDDWSIQAVQILPNPMSGTITNGIIKDTPSNVYLGGTNTVTFSGYSTVKALNVHDGRLAVKGKQLQAFNVRLATTAGSVLQHRIGSSGSSELAGSFTSKISGASVTLTNTPTGAAAFVNGGSLLSSGNQFVLDVTDQVAADAICMANIVYNNTGTALNVSPYIVTSTVGGVAKVRLYLEFRDNTGAAFSLTGMGASKIIEIQVLAFLA